MSHRYVRRLAVAASILVLTGAAAGGIWRQAYVEALEQLDRTGRSDLALAADRLTGELQRFRANAAITAQRPEVLELLQGGADADETSLLLQQIADITGSLDIIVADAAGAIQAQARIGLTEEPLAGTLHFERALYGALGLQHGVSEAHGRRVFSFASPVFGPDGPVLGAVIVTVDVESVEAEWRGGRPAVFFTDASGIIFISNRSELVLTARFNSASDDTETGPEIGAGLQTFQPDNRWFPAFDIWRIDGSRYLPKRALHLAQPVPVIGLTGETLLDVAPARAVATARAAAVAGILLALGTILFWAMERRRALAHIATMLQARVVQRTAELVAVNADLTREAAERREAETQLATAQADLVQAGKLSALGQMSAGLSHELNQPLMAIRSFAENAEALLQAGKTDVAGQNLLRISELARRMGRIIRNLRAFSRQETEDMAPVDLNAAIDAALEMVEARLRSADIALEWHRPATAMIVRGGDVRLQQVALNLVSNAADAMEGRDVRQMSVSVTHNGALVRLRVRDTGAGIAEPEKIFNPFYSTKQVGAETVNGGMGLGLSISYGIIKSFGGQIKARNLEGGGAEFVVDLIAGDVAALAAE